MKVDNIELYEGNNAPVKDSLSVTKVLDSETDMYQVRVEIGNSVFYLGEHENNDFIYMLENAE